MGSPAHISVIFFKLETLRMNLWFRHLEVHPNCRWVFGRMDIVRSWHVTYSPLANESKNFYGLNRIGIVHERESHYGCLLLKHITAGVRTTFQWCTKSEITPHKVCSCARYNTYSTCCTSAVCPSSQANTSFETLKCTKCTDSRPPPLCQSAVDCLAELQ